MRRPSAPLWLTEPTRFAALSPRTARAALFLLALVLLASLSALTIQGPPAVSHDPAKRADDQADVVLYETIVEEVRHGGSYYPVAAQALRVGDYPLKPFITFRLPTLARIQAALPFPAVTALLYTLVGAVVLAWWARLKPAFARPPPRLIALALLAGGLMAFVQPSLVYFHEIWAGLLIALSLGLWRPGDWVPAVAFGLAAALIRETAGLYLALMAVLAWVSGGRRESVAWAGAAAVLAIVLALHAHAVSEVVRPLDPASPGWSGRLGFGFFIQTISISTALAIAPLALAAPLVALSLVGWAGWRSPVALRVLALLLAYAGILAVFGRADTFYWGLLIAPLSLVGLAFVPDAARDLLVAALDKRRITVRRVVR